VHRRPSRSWLQSNPIPSHHTTISIRSAEHPGSPGRTRRVDGKRGLCPCGAQGLDLVLIATGTLSHLLTNDDALECFRCANAALAARGLLVLQARAANHQPVLTSGPFLEQLWFC
jgi:hypothetical protein